MTSLRWRKVGAEQSYPARAVWFPDLAWEGDANARDAILCEAGIVRQEVGERQSPHVSHQEYRILGSTAA